MTIRGVLFDLAGVLHHGDEAYPGAFEAVRRVREAGLGVRFVTNTSRSTRKSIVERLRGLGFELEMEEVFSAPLAARAYLSELGLSPYLVIHPDLAEDFADVAGAQPDAVLVADAADDFTYQNLNTAFRLLMTGAPLVAVAKNRYFQDGDELSLDAGPFVVALEYAADVRAHLVGKPAKDFFLAPVRDMDCEPHEVIMVGDDVEADVCGACNAGLLGILVQTGKFRAGDEVRLPSGNAWLKTDVTDAVEFILENAQQEGHHR